MNPRPIPDCAVSLVASLCGVARSIHLTPASALSPPRSGGWWNDEGASVAQIPCISANRKLTSTKENIGRRTTVSTGKPGFSTPPGHYTVLSKDADNVSTIFGDYVDRYGGVVRSNIDARKDSRPKGSHFDGARMPYAMFFRGGYAMHQGYVPPFAASHGCIRIPKGMASQFFEHASVGTPVTVTE